MLMPWLSQPDPGPSIPDEETTYLLAIDAEESPQYQVLGGGNSYNVLTTAEEPPTVYRIEPTRR